MNNRDDIKKAGQNPTEAEDQGEDSDERRKTAEKVWRDRSGVPRGTPEQGERSADRVGGDGTSRPGREIDDDSVEPPQKRAPEVDDIDENR